MPCEACTTGLPKGQNFCAICGSAEEQTIATLNSKVIALAATIAELSGDADKKEQTFLEVDTAERVAKRLMTWATYFGFFVALPTVIILIGFGLWLGKNIKDLNDFVGSAQTSVKASLDRARDEAKGAETQANNALNTSKAVNQDIQGTQQKLTALGASVNESSALVGHLNQGVTQQESKLSSLSQQTASQARVVEGLNQKVQTLDKSKVEQTIASIHPEYGTVTVRTVDGTVLTKASKPPSEDYVSIDIYNRDSISPHLTLEKIGEGLQELEKGGFHYFFGSVNLTAIAGGSSTGLATITYDFCRIGGNFRADDQTLGAPCIVYFNANYRDKALRARALLTSVQSIPDQKVVFVSPASLDEGHREIVEKSGLDMAIVLGP